MSEENEILTFEGDASSLIESLDLIDTALQIVSASVDSLMSSFDGLSSVDDVLSGLDAQLSATASETDVLSASIQQLSSSASEDTASLDTMGVSLDQITANMDLLAQMTADGAATATVSIQVLADEIDVLDATTLTSTDTITAMQASFDALNATLAEDTQIISTLNESIANLQAQISALTMEESAADDATAGWSAMLDSLVGVIGGVNAALGSLDGMIASVGDMISSAMGPLTMIATILGMAGGAFIKMGMDAQDSLSIAQGLAGVTKDQIEQLKGKAVDLGLTMKNVGDIMYYVSSANYTGATAMTVFDLSARAAQGTGSDMAQTTSALTSVFHAYNVSAQDMSLYTDKAIMAVKGGKQTMQLYASSIGPAAAAASRLGISFSEVNAAEMALTQLNPKVAQDSQQLTGLMVALEGDTGKMAKTAKSLGISFDENHYKSLDLLGQLKYLQEQTGNNQTAFTKLTGGVRGHAAALAILSDGGVQMAANLKLQNNALGTNAAAYATHQQTVSAAMGRVNAAISVMALNTIDALGPKLIPIIDKITGAIVTFTDMVTHHTNDMMPVLAALAAFIGTVMVGAVVALLVTLGPVLLVITAIAAAVALGVYSWQHQADVMKQVNQVMQIPWVHTILSALQGIGSFIASSFQPAWQQLADSFNGQLKPAWDTLTGAFKQAGPLLQAIATGAGVVAAVIGGLLVGAISGAIAALGSILRGAILIVVGVIQVFAGLISFFVGFFSLLYDLSHGNWGRIKGDIDVMLKGIVQIIQGAISIIVGLWFATMGAMMAFTDGFTKGIVGFFHWLSDILVGHSIIPDMIDAIVQWFEQLPGRTGDAVGKMIASVTKLMGDLAAKATHWAGDMVANFAGGILSNIGKVASAASSLAGSIASFLHFSVPDTGPLASSDKWMDDFGTLMANGLGNQKGKVQASAKQLASGISEGTLKDLAKHAQSILDAFSKVAQGINKTIDPINHAMDRLAGFGRQIDGLRKTSDAIVDAFKHLGPAIHDAMKPATDAQKAFDLLAPSMKKAFDAVEASIGTFKKLGPAFQETYPPIKLAVDSLLKISDAIHKATEPVGNALKGIANMGSSMKTMADSADRTVSSFKKLPDVLAASDKDAKIVITDFGNVVKAIHDLGKAFDEETPKLSKVGPQLKTAEQPIQDAAKAYDKIAKSLKDAFTPIDKALQGLQGLKKVIADIFSPIKTASDSLDKLPKIITNTHQPIVDMGKDFTDLEKTIETKLNDILNIVLNYCETFVKLFDQMRTQVDTSVDTLTADLSSRFAILAVLAYTWGSDFVHGLVQGMDSQQGALATSATALAATISDRLHHTEPSKGPMVGDSHWMAHFGANLVNGLNAQQNAVAAAAHNVAKAITTPVHGATGATNADHSKHKKGPTHTTTHKTTTTISGASLTSGLNSIDAVLKQILTAIQALSKALTQHSGKGGQSMIDFIGSSGQSMFSLGSGGMDAPTVVLPAPGQGQGNQGGRQQNVLQDLLSEQKKTNTFLQILVQEGNMGGLNIGQLHMNNGTPDISKLYRQINETSGLELEYGSRNASGY